LQRVISSGSDFAAMRFYIATIHWRFI